MQRPFHVSPWQLTIACGLFKILLAAAALALPLTQVHVLPRLVGWMLLAGGMSELLLSWTGRHSWTGRLTFGSGALTVVLAAMFLGAPWHGLHPLAAFVMIWFLLRGILSLDVGFQSRLGPTANWAWLLVRGFADLGLGLALMAGAPLAMFAIVIFGEVREFVAVFSATLAISFAVAGISLINIGLSQRQQKLTNSVRNGN
ncbi:DUF308 domain-containing protein [Sphingobium bisphenolivorans]|uniref:DUF308 domain-containing protein n=1 Tax=Sphingobium bisphenolivorans TaxID=1335760 RepID=UPI0003B391AE|nr:DUF308 domain-containing protein [Sphingobium bisphenolivorans]